MRIFEATDKLTIRRLMTLMAGIAVALVVFRNRNTFDPWDTDRWRELATTVLLGCSLPGLFCTLGQQGRDRAGLGSLLWSTLSIGSLLMLPPAIGGPLLHNEAM